ncbi:hypothetical protein EZS27_034284 [termite gut metagenome]|uniref:Uncharacterized protein n=1 Tax=termite gut metagenome TaxID=433724 RepID=A0A5J4Q025_9ZZZZ
MEIEKDYPLCSLMRRITQELESMDVGEKIECTHHVVGIEEGEA